MSKTQRLVWDALGDGMRVRYWPSGGFAAGHFSLIDAKGEYVKIVHREANGRCIPHTAIPALVKKGLLVEVRSFKADATGKRGYEYAKNPAISPAKSAVQHPATPPRPPGDE